MKTFFITTALAAFSFSAVALADGTTYTYRVKVPALAGASCANHAQSLAATFSQQTGAQAVSGTCQSTDALTEAGQQFTREVIVISYTADAPFQPYQAIFGGTAFEGHSELGSPLFAAYSECLSQLAKFSPQFEAETGIAVLAGHCDAGDEIGTPGYSLTMEGFGQPTKSLFGHTEDSGLVGDAFTADVIKAAAAALKAAGADIAYTDSTRVYYYAPFDPSVSEDDLGSFSVAAQCTDQQAAAKAIFDQAGMAGATALCEPFGRADSTQMTLMVVGAGLINSGDDYGAGSPAYDSYEECKTDLPRLIANAGANGGTVYGGICSPDDSALTGFKARLFTSF